MQRVVCSVLVSSISSILLVPQIGLSEDDGLCFLRTESGRIINLDALCARHSQEKPMRRITTELDPRYVTYGPGGSIGVKGGADVSFQLPDGRIVDPDLTTTQPDGTKYQPIVKDGKYLGLQFFRPDGTLAEPGETVTLPNGKTVQQASF